MINVNTNGRGMYEITGLVGQKLSEQKVNDGVLHLFLQHTSCSLLIQENADPSAKDDLEEFFCRVAPDGQSWHRHTAEGVDDTSSHMKASICNVSLSIPVIDGRMALGTWQGIFLFEHRLQPHHRKVVMTFLTGGCI